MRFCPLKFDIHFGHFYFINFLQIFIWRRQYVEENQCEIYYNECMADKDLGPILRIFGVRYSKVVYFLTHAIVSLVLSLVGFACYH